MSALRIITAAAAGGSIRVRGTECAYVVRDDTGVLPDIAVMTAEDLRELLPTLQPVSTKLDCTPAERRALRQLCGILDAS